MSARLDGSYGRVQELLALAYARDFRVVHLGLLAAGQEKDWSATYSLVQMLRGLRRYAVKHRSACPSAVIHVVDDKVLLPLYAGKLHVEEILSCNDVRFWCEVVRKEAQLERVLMIRAEDELIGSVAKVLHMERPGWRVQVLPKPFRGFQSEVLEAVADLTLEQYGILQGSTLVFDAS